MDRGLYLSYLSNNVDHSFLKKKEYLNEWLTNFSIYPTKRLVFQKQMRNTKCRLPNRNDNIRKEPYPPFF